MKRNFVAKTLFQLEEKNVIISMDENFFSLVN